MRNQNAGIGLSKGSPYANIIEIDPSDGSTSGTMIPLPWIKDSSFDDSHTDDETPDEGGNIFKTPGTVNRSFSVTFMQLDKGTKELGYSLADKTYRLVKEEHITAIDGKFQYKIYGMVQFSKTTTKAAQGGEIPYTVNVLNNAFEIGVDLSAHAESSFQSTLTGTFTIPKNQGSVIAEIAV